LNYQVLIVNASTLASGRLVIAGEVAAMTFHRAHRDPVCPVFARDKLRIFALLLAAVRYPAAQERDRADADGNLRG